MVANDFFQAFRCKFIDFQLCIELMTDCLTLDFLKVMSISFKNHSLIHFNYKTSTPYTQKFINTTIENIPWLATKVFIDAVASWRNLKCITP